MSSTYDTLSLEELEQLQVLLLQEKVQIAESAARETKQAPVFNLLREQNMINRAKVQIAINKKVNPPEEEETFPPYFAPLFPRPGRRSPRHRLHWPSEDPRETVRALNSRPQFVGR